MRDREPGKGTLEASSRELLAFEQEQYLDNESDLVRTVSAAFEALFSNQDPEKDLELRSSAKEYAAAVEAYVSGGISHYGLKKEDFAASTKAVAECAGRFGFCDEVSRGGSSFGGFVDLLDDPQSFTAEVIELLGDIAPQLPPDAMPIDIPRGLNGSEYHEALSGNGISLAQWSVALKQRLREAGVHTCASVSTVR